MNPYSLKHLSDEVLLRGLVKAQTNDCRATAELLAHVAEVDGRKLYLPAAYPSMHAYCMGELHMSEDAAYKRIQCARAARQFPGLFDAIAEGRLHLTGVVRLAPYLRAGNADELIAAASHLNKADIEQLLAARFPRPDLPACVRSLAPTPALACQLVPEPVGMTSPEHAATSEPAPRIEARSPERFSWQVTVSCVANDKLRYARELLGHRLPAGDMAVVLETALDALIQKLEKSRFAATDKPSAAAGDSASPRSIPASVKRAVWMRDEGRCTLAGENDRRCDSRTRLEFDHVLPVARGGEASAANLRLRCRAHNQYEAERVFGAAFMDERRRVARTRRASGDKERVSRSAVGAGVPLDADRDVTPWLRQLGFSAAEARSAAAYCATRAHASLEERVREALAYLTPAHRRPRKVFEPAA